jgi:hypothetical protein
MSLSSEPGSRAEELQGRYNPPLNAFDLEMRLRYPHLGYSGQYGDSERQIVLAVGQSSTSISEMEPEGNFGSPSLTSDGQRSDEQTAVMSQGQNSPSEQTQSAEVLSSEDASSVHSESPMFMNDEETTIPEIPLDEGVNRRLLPPLPIEKGRRS